MSPTRATDAPDPQHIDAIARHLPNIVPWDRLTEGCRKGFRLDAQEILDDPECIPAMLDALTRHGVLTQQHTARWHGGVEAWLSTERREIGSDEALAILREKLTREVAP